eukprot:m.720840 g.720840  ORF g.720840 m.720840 type:complete len:172 (+) comp23008_c0_seq12:288-803(+)
MRVSRYVDGMRDIWGEAPIGIVIFTTAPPTSHYAVDDAGQLVVQSSLPCPGAVTTAVNITYYVDGYPQIGMGHKEVTVHYREDMCARCIETDAVNDTGGCPVTSTPYTLTTAAEETFDRAVSQVSQGMSNDSAVLIGMGVLVALCVVVAVSGFILVVCVKNRVYPAELDSV